MPLREPDPSDPHELVAVSLPGNLDSVREMAWTFAEEYAARGFDRERVVGLFRRPFYAAPHRAWKVLGEAEIRRIVDEAHGFWGRVRRAVEEPPRLGGRTERGG